MCVNVEGLYFDPRGYAWCYTYTYVQDGVNGYLLKRCIVSCKKVGLVVEAVIGSGGGDSDWSSYSDDAAQYVVTLSQSHLKSAMMGALHQHVAGLMLMDRLNELPFLRPILGLDYGLHPLIVDADVLELANYAKDNKIILVYVEHKSTNVDLRIFVKPNKGVAIAVDTHLRKAPIEIDSETPLFSTPKLTII
ncbi:hypothetical protein Tco_1486943 [Tanacetum coccineum]